MPQFLKQAAQGTLSDANTTLAAILVNGHESQLGVLLPTIAQGAIRLDKRQLRQLAKTAEVKILCEAKGASA